MIKNLFIGLLKFLGVLVGLAVATAIGKAVGVAAALTVLIYAGIAVFRGLPGVGRGLAWPIGFAAIIALTSTMVQTGDRLAGLKDSAAPLTVEDKCQDAVASSTETDRIPGMKVSFDIVLQERVDEKCLKHIVAGMYDGLKSDYSKVFLGFHIKGKSKDHGYWATGHNGNPKIIGMKKGEYEKFSRQAMRKPAKGEQVIGGPWFWERGIGSANHVLIRKNGQLYMNTVYRDGSKADEPLEVRTVRGQQRYYIKGNDFGEYFVVRGPELDIADQSGILGTAHNKGG